MNIDPTLLASNRPLFLIAVGVVTLSLVVALLALIVFGHHIASDRERKRNRERFEGATNVLAPCIVGKFEELETAVAEARRKYGDRAVSLVLRRARYDVRGEGAETISRVLSRMGAIDQLKREARSRREWRRLAAVRGLGECGGEEARTLLMASADDPVGEVRRAAREGLLADGSPEAIHAAIASFLVDLPRRAGWRRSFYARLASVASNELLKLIESKKLSPGEEKLALEALGDAGWKAALPLAVAHAVAEDPELRATGIRVVGKIGGHSELRLVLDRLNDPEWFVRAAAARALETMLSPARPAGEKINADLPITNALGSKLTDTSWWVRANAARALSRASRAGTEVLLTAGEGTDRYARDAALAALAMAEVDPASRARIDNIVKNLLAEKPAVRKQPSLQGRVQLGGAA